METSRRPTNPIWRTAAILKKTVKSTYLCDRSTDFDDIWHDDTYWPLAADQPLTLLTFWKFKMLAATILKNHKNRIVPTTGWPFFTKFGALMKNGLLTFSTVKNLNFTNPRWRTAAILKTVKLPYLCNRLTDFDEIWHGDAHCPLTVDRPLKFRIFENPTWRWPQSWKSQKSRYLRNDLTDLYEIWYGGAKWGS